MKKLSYLLSVVLTILILILFNSISQAQTSFNISNKTTGDTLLTIDNDGNVGIGTTTPTSSIEVKSSAVENFSSLRLGNLDGSRYLFIHSGDATYYPIIRWHEGQPLRFATWTETFTEHMRIAANGNLGIGTTDPTAKLDVRGSNTDEGGVFRLGNSDLTHQLLLFGGRENDPNPFIFWKSGDPLRFCTDEDGWSEKMRIAANGNVGIGTETPGTMLEVAGTIHSTTGGFQFPDQTVQTTAFTSGGGNTLDLAYDQGGAGAGRDITADNGSVRILGNDGLYVQGDINTSGSVHGGGSLFLYGSDNEGGQISLRDGDDDNGWIIDNYGSTDNEALRFFRGSGLSNALVINNSGDVGIGTGGPSADLHVDGTDGILFGGTYGSGTIPAEGSSTRMMWYPAKAALRAGQVESEYFWDDDSVGSHSTAFGKNTRASGTASLAIGNVARAQGNNSVALGNLNMASGNSSLAMGSITVASGSNSSAMGYTTTASGNYSIAAGYESTASGHWSTAIGNNTEAIGDNSFAIGQNSTSSGQVSTAMGFYTNATGSASTSLGSATTASGNMSLAAGLSTTASGDYSVALGRHIEAAGEGSIAIGLQDMDDIQITQESTMAIMGGKVGIGITTPIEMLEVGGTVHSTTGGFRFPDGTLQTSAATGGGGASSIDDLTDGKTGGYSVFLGSGAGANDDNGDNHNTAVGTNALNLTTTGAYNTAVGSSALVSNVGGQSNTAFGHWALYMNTTGEHNVGIGPSANMRNQAGSNNTMIGFAAGGGSTAHSKSGNVFIGHMAGVWETGDNKLYIENSDSDTPLIGGDFASDEIYLNGRVGIGTTSPSAGLHLHGIGFPSSFMYLSSETGGSAGFRLYEGSTAKWHIFNSYTLDGLQIYNDNGQTVFYADQTTSNVGIRTTNPTSTLTVAGTIECDVLEINGGSDIAEPFDIEHTKGIEAGMVMAIDPDNPGKIKVSEKAYDRCVAGILSGAGGINPGMIMGQSGTIADGEFPVALTGRVYCRADASNGSINPGDLLTTSDIPGHAMKVVNYTKAQGAVIGKAMSALDEGQGLILVLVSLQ